MSSVLVFKVTFLPQDLLPQIRNSDVNKLRSVARSHFAEAQFRTILDGNFSSCKMTFKIQYIFALPGTPMTTMEGMCLTWQAFTHFRAVYVQCPNNRDWVI
jgi:hypothetical protein